MPAHELPPAHELLRFRLDYFATNELRKQTDNQGTIRAKTRVKLEVPTDKSEPQFSLNLVPMHLSTLKLLLSAAD